MGAIKDATDLILALEKKISDRKILKMLLPIKQAIIQAEKENLDLEKLHFRQEREFGEKMDNLKSQHKREVEKLYSELDSLKLEIKNNASRKGMVNVPLVRR